MSSLFNLNLKSLISAFATAEISADDELIPAPIGKFELISKLKGDILNPFFKK